MTLGKSTRFLVLAGKAPALAAGGLWLAAVWSTGVGAALVLSACGPSFEGQGALTPQQQLDEEMKAAEEEEKRRAQHGDTGGPVQDDSDVKRFDKKQVKMELQRATRSAESCPGVVKDQETKENKQRGTFNVSITFQEDGTVKTLQVPSPYDGTPVGDCVARAYKAVIIPPYNEGGDQIVDWEVTLEDAKPSADEAKKADGKKPAAKKAATQKPAAKEAEAE